MFTGNGGETLWTLVKRCDDTGAINCDCGDWENTGRNGPSIFGPVVDVCGGNFRGPNGKNSPFQRGYGLEETLFHECLHWARFGGTDPGSASFDARLFRKLERVCYDWPPADLQ